MSKAIRGLTSVKALPVWAVLISIVILSIVLSGPNPVLADEPDADSDGVPDSIESLLGTDPDDADSDDDNWDDGREVWVEGTDPLSIDTDGDALTDSTDPYPLMATGTDGGDAVTYTYSSNLGHETLVDTSPWDGVAVNVSSGEFVWRERLYFGSSVLQGGASIVLTWRSGVDYDGNYGHSVFSNVDHWIVVQQDDDVEVYLNGIKGVFNESAGSYSAPAGWPFSLSFDSQEEEYTLTAIRGGMSLVFDSTNGRLKKKQDRFGNSESYTRNQDGVLTSITTAEGLTISVSHHESTDRISDFTGPGSRQYHIDYNCKGGLARLFDAEGAEKQFFGLYGQMAYTLKHNPVRILDEMGRTIIENQYDGDDRVVIQERGSDQLVISYDTQNNQATVTDWTGNQRKYTFGSPVATQVIVYANRSVNPANPTSWTYTYTYNSNYLRTKTVFPRGNSIKYTWDSNYCLTTKRMKQDDTQQDDNNNDLIWSYTYGTTYCQIKNSTDPQGNTTQRTLDSKERVTKVTYPTITHLDPDVTIEENFTWNTDGTIATHTDGEGNVTKYDYYSTGSKKSLLWKVTRDYGTGKLNLVTAYDYTDARFKSSETDPDSNTWSFTVDDMGRVTKETSPSSLDYETTYTFNAAGQVTQRNVENVDKTGSRDTGNPWWTTTYSYDSLGRHTDTEEEITSSTTRTTSYSYTPNGKLEGTTLPEGNKLKNVWSERGRLFKSTRGYGSSDAASEEYTYDGNGNLTIRKDGRGKSWTSTYDLFDRKSKDTTPEGHYTSYVLDKNGNVTEVKNYDDEESLLAHTKSTYDEMSRRWKTERWLDQPAPASDDWLATTYVFDRNSRVVETVDPEANSTYCTFDGAGRKAGWEDALGNEVNYGYSGDCCSATEIEEVEQKPGGGTETFCTELVFDALNRVTERRIVDRDNSSNKHVFKSRYTSLNVAVEREDAEGNKTYYEHDGLGRVTKSEVDIGGTDKIETWFTFDANDNQTGLEDDNGNETAWTFSERDLPTAIIYEDSTSRTFTYNDDDSLSGWEDENGTEVANTYDNDGRLTYRTIDRATNVLGPTSETYAYDGLGRMTTAQNTNSTVYFTYDTLSRLTEEEQGPNPIGGNGKTISYTYNDDGSRASVEYFSGYNLTYTVDSIGRWTKIEDASSNDLATWEYYGPSRRTKKLTHLNGTTANYAYDGFRRVTDIAHKDSSSTEFAGFDYAYDKMGNPLYVERSHDSGAGDIYAYDKAYRLTSALIGSTDPSAEVMDEDWLDYAHQKRIDYGMDDVSNRTSVVETPYGQQGTSTGYTTNSVNWYTIVAGVSRTHDANGSITSDATYDYYYDYQNNLVRVEESSAIVAEYEFDALNRRISRTAGSEVTHTYYDGEHAVEEYDGSHSLLKKFIYGQRIDEILLMIALDVADVDDDQDTAEAISFCYHTDMLGSATHVTGPNESIVERCQYEPYGNATIKDGSGANLSGFSAIGNPYTFSARRHDEETGLFHFRRRAYDPLSGRFLQRDPLGSNSERTTYDYCRSQPTLWIDPRGEKSIHAEVAEPPVHAHSIRPVCICQNTNSGHVAWESQWCFWVRGGMPAGYDRTKAPMFIAQEIRLVTHRLDKDRTIVSTSESTVWELFRLKEDGGAEDYDTHLDPVPYDPPRICGVRSEVYGKLRVARITNRKATARDEWFIAVSYDADTERYPDMDYVNMNGEASDDVDIEFDMSYGQKRYSYEAEAFHLRPRRANGLIAASAMGLSHERARPWCEPWDEGGWDGLDAWYDPHPLEDSMDKAKNWHGGVRRK